LIIRSNTRKPAETLVFFLPPFTPIYSLLISFTDKFDRKVDSSYLCTDNFLTY